MKQKILNKPNCIIAARGNSKRLKNKNILKVNGKSLIEIVIKNAIKSKIFDKIIVSTDSKKIAKIAKKSGAIVPFLRTKKLSSDKAGLLPVVKNVPFTFGNVSVRSAVGSVTANVVSKSLEVAPSKTKGDAPVNVPIVVAFTSVQDKVPFPFVDKT